MIQQLVSAARRKPVWVHLDVDVIDPSECPAVVQPSEGGPSVRAVGDVLRTLGSVADVRGKPVAEILDVLVQRRASIRRTGQVTVGAIPGRVLLEEEEMGRIGLGGLLDGVRSAGLETLWLPIRDDTAPSDIGEVAQLVGRVLDHLAAGRTVVIHCHGGLGRSLPGLLRLRS